MGMAGFVWTIAADGDVETAPLQRKE
jgi:hypothetical protein